MSEGKIQTEIFIEDNTGNFLLTKHYGKANCDDVEIQICTMIGAPGFVVMSEGMTFSINLKDVVEELCGHIYEKVIEDRENNKQTDLATGENQSEPPAERCVEKAKADPALSRAPVEGENPIREQS